MEKGLVHVYTGDGKGKSTSAFGLAIRAAGAGKRVFIVQFLKSAPSSELKSLKKLGPNIQVFRFEKPRDFVWNLSPEQKDELKKEVREAFLFACDSMKNGDCDMLIMDETMGAISNGFIGVDELVEALDNRGENVEVILTGRDVPEKIIEAADYVSEIKCIKHPYQKGIGARKGIEF